MDRFPRALMPSALVRPKRAEGAARLITYERLLVDGIPYFVNGLGGASIYSFVNILPESQMRYNADYGAMLVQASDTSITFHLSSRGSELIETYTIDK